MDSTCFHDPNVVICKVISRGQRTPLIGVYLPPSTLDHLPDLEESQVCCSYQDPIMMGDLKAYISQSQKTRS